MVRISAGSCQNLKNWNLLQSGQALGIMTIAGKFSNADAIFVGVRSCCLLPSHRNNLVENQVCGFINAGSLLNSLPLEIKSSPSHPNFMNRLKSYYHVAKHSILHLLGVNSRLTAVRCMVRLAHSPLNTNKKSYRICVCGDIET